MPKVDTQNWKSFRLDDLFEILLAKGDIQPKQIPAGDIPLVSAGNEDNGIVAMIDAAGDGVSEMFPAGCISVSMFGRAFYQLEAFYAVSHGRINVLKPVRRLSYEQGLFIASCLNRSFVHKFDYSTMCTQKKLMRETVFLPATPDGQPDWAYMDAYMGEIIKKEEAFAEPLAALAADAIPDGHKLDTSEWKAFRIGDLFEKLNLGFKANRKFDKALDVDTSPSEEFNLPLVNAKDGNNGIMYWGRSSDWDTAEMTLDIVQNGAVATGNVYAQPQRTGVLFDAYLVKPKFDVSVELLQFLASVTQKSVKQHFSYFNKCTWDRVSVLPIYLPATPDGQPDWEWMEQYMQQQMDKAAVLVDHLDAVWN